MALRGCRVTPVARGNRQPRKGEHFFGGTTMSDMHDATGLRATCKTYSDVQYEFEPASGTIWGYMNQRGNPCFNLGLLKDLRSFSGDRAVLGSSSADKK